MDSIHDIRAQLRERERELLAQLEGVRGLLGDLEGFVERAKQFLPSTAALPSPSPTLEVSDPPKQSEPENEGDPAIEDAPITDLVLDHVVAKGDSAVYEKAGVTREIRETTNSKVEEKQISTALRGLEKRGKIKLIRPGGPRKPAIYANLGYTGTFEDAEDGSPEEVQG